MLWKKIGFRDEKSRSPLSSRKDQIQFKSLNEDSFNKNYETITRSRFHEIKQDLQKSNSKDNSLVILKSRICKDQGIQEPTNKSVIRPVTQRFKAATSNDLYKQDIHLSNSFLKKFEGSQSKLFSPINSNKNIKKKQTFSRDTLNEFNLINEMIDPEQIKSENFKMAYLQNKLSKYQQIVNLYKKEVRFLKMDLQQFVKGIKNQTNKYRLLIQTFYSKLIKYLNTTNNFNERDYLNRINILKQKQKIILEKQKQLKLKQQQFENISKQIENRQSILSLKQKDLKFKKQQLSQHTKKSINQQENKKILIELKKKEDQLEQKKKQLILKQSEFLMKSNILLNKQKELLETRQRRNSCNVQNELNHNIPLVKRLNDMKTTLAGINICNQEFQKTLLKQSLRRSKQSKQKNI